MTLRASRWYDLSAFAVRPFRWYVIAAFASLVGTRMQRLVLAWITWQTTKSGVWLGMVSFAELIPILILAPVAGILIDKYGPGRVLIWSQVLAVLQSILILWLYLCDALDGTTLFAATLLLGIASAFNVPADLSMVPRLVDRSKYTSATSLSSALSNVGVLAGPALAGAVLAIQGPALAIILNGISSFALLIVVARLSSSDAARTGKDREVGDPVSMRSSHQFAAFALVILSAGVLSLSCRSLIQVLAAYTNGVLHEGAGYLGYCTAAIGLGAAIGGMWMGRLPGRESLAIPIAGSALGCSLVLFVLGFAPSVWIAPPLLVLFGAGLGVNGVATQSFIQLSAAESIRGRVLALYSMTFRGGIALGAVGFGALVSFTSPVNAVIAAGVISGALGLAVIWQAQLLAPKVPLVTEIART
jgi:MFS family permease